MFSSCAVGRDYTAPELSLPDTFAEADGVGESVEKVDSNWWAAFQDSLLDELIVQAVKSNKTVAQGLSRINQARALRRQSLSELLPGAQLQGAYEKSQNSAARFPGGGSGFTYEVYNGSVDASWELDIFGRLRRDYEAKNAELDASIAQFQDVLRMVIAEVASTYFDLRGTQAELEIARRNVAIQEETLTLVQARVDAGQASELDSAQAKAQLSATRATIAPLEVDVKMHVHRLSVLVGQQPKGLAAELSAVSVLPEFRGPLQFEAPTTLIRRRPDLRAAERALAAQTALIGVAEGDLYPKLEILGSLGVEAPDVDGLTKGAGVYRWGPSLTWAPFDTGKLRARIRQQDARAEEALYVYEQAVLEALEDVENSFARYSSEQSRRKHLRDALRASTRAHQLAKEQYKEGVTNFLTVLDAERSMLENDANFVRSEKSAALALVGIYKALGGGWENWRLSESSTSSNP